MLKENQANKITNIMISLLLKRWKKIIKSWDESYENNTENKI